MHPAREITVFNSPIHQHHILLSLDQFPIDIHNDGDKILYTEEAFVLSSCSGSNFGKPGRFRDRME
jgi:hypothetical protein